MKKLLTLALLAVSGQAHVAFAQAAGPCVDITGLPATIAQPGKYCLASDFTLNSATVKAITVAANDVTLDCQGHSIRNAATSNTGTAEGVYAYARNSVTVKNCRIQGGFANGISFMQDNAASNKNYYINIENNYIAGAYSHGIRAFGSAIEIRNNRVYDIGGQANTYAFGIRVGGSTLASAFRFHLVHDNVVAGTNSPYNNAYGIYSENSVAGLFRMNDVTGTKASNPSFRSYAFRIGGTVNTVSDNHVVGSPLSNDTGILASSASTDCYDNNIRSPVPTTGCDASLGNY